MIQFNTLKISQDSKTLSIDLQIEDKSYYRNMYLKAIYIDTQDTFVDSTTPSNTPVFKYFFPDDTSTEYHISLDKLDLNGTDLSNNIFFVFVEVAGTPGPDTPCGEDNIFTIGTVYSKYPIYEKWYSYIKEINNSCCIPQNFIDYFLRIEALNLSISVNDYLQTVYLYKNYFKDYVLNKQFKNCNCNG
ncbi:MAG: hypothetical protein LBM96_05790 [Methanobrevibacter sp.]|jgi:hypothetical protein|nr:hypothetical protein [Candidatus Methanoflexus mossambicus]